MAVPHVLLSNICGFASLVCWLVVFTPQLWTNYKRQSGESLSLVFLYIWLAGDIMNLVGATMDNLLLTMRVLAWYYTVADILLIVQVFYYRRTSVKASFEAVITQPSSAEALYPSSTSQHVTTPGERTGLNQPQHTGYFSINQTVSDSSDIMDGHVHETEHERALHKAAMAANATAASLHQPHHHHHHHHHNHERRPSTTHSTMTSSSSKQRSKMLKRRKAVRKLLIIVMPILATAFFVWAYYDWLECTIGGGEDGDPTDGDRCGRGRGHRKLPPSPTPPSAGEGDAGSFYFYEDELSAMMKGKKPHKKPTNPDEPTFYDTYLPLIMGWGSAVLYLGSRIPQIYKNWRLKSCEGLSIMMFFFSVFGNVFYVASIFLNSLDRDYLIKNMPWWLGSGGTLLFDFTIFAQFYIYRNNKPLTDALLDAVASGELNPEALIAAGTDDEDEDSEDDYSSLSSESSTMSLPNHPTVAEALATSHTPTTDSSLGLQRREDSENTVVEQVLERKGRKQRQKKSGSGTKGGDSSIV